MVPRKQVSPLADADAIPDPDRGVVVDPDQLAQPHVIADLKKPGVLDGDPGLADEPLTDSGAEGTQDGRLPA